MTLGTNDAASDVAAATLLVVDGQDPEPAKLRELVADVGLQHLRAVGVDREPDLVAPERVEDPAELVPTRHDPGVEIRGRADLEHDPAVAKHPHRPGVIGGLDAMADPVRLEELHDPPDLLDRTRLTGVHRETQTELARATEQASVVRYPEGRRLGPGDIDADHAAVPPSDRLLGDDLVQLVREGTVEAEDQARLDRVFESRLVHSSNGRSDDVVEVLLAAAVSLHRVEAQLHGGDVVLPVRPADDLVDGTLDGERAALDQLGPVEELEIAIEGAVPPRRHRDHVAELPVVLRRELDPLRMGDAPHDRRSHGAAEMTVELGEGDLAREDGRHDLRITSEACLDGGPV